jgi:tetratricopeptide (TPR) repeat protein
MTLLCAPRRRLLAVSRSLSLATLIAAPVALTGSDAWADKPAAASADAQKATALFQKGNDLFKANKYAPALEQFKQSYALLPSPNSHLYVARCLAQLGKARDAWIEFDRTADEATAGGEKYAQTHDTAVQERDELAPKVALVSVVVPDAAKGVTVRVGAYDIPPDHVGRPYPVDPGTAEVVVQAPGRAPAHQSVTANLGERREVTLAAGPEQGEPPPPPPETGKGLNGLRVGGIVAGGVGVVGLILFAAEGAASKSTYNQLSQMCNGQAGCAGQAGAGRASADSLISSGKTQQAVANAGLAIGVIGIAAGATLIGLSFRKAPSDAAPATTSELVLGPKWAGVKGTF